MGGDATATRKDANNTHRFDLGGLLLYLLDKLVLGPAAARVSLA